ncbi:unnamed protein product [Cyprideis torosa]|uniref:Uncharacterized protein n=1 Tax=Cyprideis torosa TaxID=163714 RepID=A0A7R8WLF8_9CRUS|nr:unnamed protein product [Cyprideis torosa]CAG0904280.1 unnamed protein product [Cyprideis torosa]
MPQNVPTAATERASNVTSPLTNDELIEARQIVFPSCAVQTPEQKPRHHDYNLLDALCSKACCSPSFLEPSDGHCLRAKSSELRKVFERYATVHNEGGDRFISRQDFVRRFLCLFREDDANPDVVDLIGGMADADNDGLISFDDFQTFEAVLCASDGLYLVVVRLFDLDHTGVISYKNFVQIIKKTSIELTIPFDFKTDFCNFYFGKKRDQTMSPCKFSQFLHDFHAEHAVQAFKRYSDDSGHISVQDFQQIIKNIKGHLLTSLVEEHLVASAELGNGSPRVSYPYFTAFISLLKNMELMKKIFLACSHGNRQAAMTRDALLRCSQTMSEVTPLEVNILFQFVALSRNSSQLKYADLEAMTPEHHFKDSQRRLASIKAVSSPTERGFFIAALESAYRFFLGGIAGAVGATAVYPIDLVKTRMQNQRSGSMVGEVMYRHSLDCFQKVLRYEGFFGLYRGLLPQLVGVAPEKAIKLTVNDFVRDRFKNWYSDRDTIPLWSECVAGGCAGFSQVFFTNPLEIVKIRLQVAGEIPSARKVSAFRIVRELGLVGLYKGASACWLRDINFSAIYFPVYANSKKYLADENGYNSPTSLFTAGVMGGVPAAFLVTPADVIKTRLQVVAREGQTKYSGIIDATRKIYAEEGFRAFWKGSAARVLRSSPQFGVTLFTYEILQRIFYVDFGGSRPAGSENPALVPNVDGDSCTASDNPDHIGGYRFAVPIIRSIETKFGICFPKIGQSTCYQELA